MTDKQPEALRLADLLERMSLSTKWDKEAAAELRRLHESSQRKEWQGLTDEEANELCFASVEEIETKLREKNT